MKRMLQLAALAIGLTLAGQAAMAIPNPNYCGDPCSPNGAQSGCRCPNGIGGYYKTICTCVNGHWVDF